MVPAPRAATAAPARVAAREQPAAGHPRTPTSLRVALAALSGLVLTLAFPPYGLWWVAPPAIAGLALLTRTCTARQGALLGLAAGLGFFLPLLHWTGVYVGPVPWLVLGIFQALYLVPLGAACAVLQRRTWWPLPVAALWVGEEALRMRWPFGGFPWGRLAFSQADAPTRGLAAVGGAPLVTFAVALTGTCLAACALALAGDRRRALAWGGGALAVVLAGLAVPVARPAGRTVTVAVIQGGVPQLGLDFNAQRAAVLGNHAAATHELAARVRRGAVAAPDLVIWPENSSDIDPYTDAAAQATITSAVDDIGVPVLVGAVVGRDARHVENDGIVWTPGQGPGASYTKRHPVPFAEYIPWRSVARRFSPYVDQVSRDFVAGRRPGVLQVGPATVADVICFEVGYDGIVRDAVRGGGQLIAVQTNNATFGHTPQTEQQLVMSRLRAVEHGRSVLVAATSGVSAIIAPDGSVQHRAGIFTRRTFVVPVRLSDRQTLATRVGEWPEWLLVVAGLGAVGVALRRRRPTRPEEA